jgi:hypothetical protein
MRGVWKRILPHCANRSDFEEEIVIEEINIGRELGFDGLENDDVRKLLNSHSEELNDDDFLLLDQQMAFEEADNDAEERDNVQVMEFTLKEFEDIFRGTEAVKQILWLLALNWILACKFAETWIKYSASTSICMKL